MTRIYLETAAKSLYRDTCGLFNIDRIALTFTSVLRTISEATTRLSGNATTSLMKRNLMIVSRETDT